MAGELAQDVAVVLALSSAAIGASGAVISQVVAGVITSKRERSKADAEAKRWKAEADHKRRDRQLDRKIELFSKFLSTVAEMDADDRWSQEAESPLEIRVSQAKSLIQLLRTAEEIGLLVPELYEYAQATYNTAANASVAHFSAEKIQAKSRAKEVLQMGRESVQVWAMLFRQAARSYISHEPVTPYQDAVVIHGKKLQEAMSNRRRRESG